MTQKLFGLDVAKLVADNVAAAGGVRTVSLQKRTPGTRTGGSLTGGTNPTGAALPCRGFVEIKEKRVEGTLVGQPMAVVSILGATVSGGSVAPEVSDVATVDGVAYELVRMLKVDPAGALYQFEGEASK